MAQGSATLKQGGVTGRGAPMPATSPPLLPVPPQQRTHPSPLHPKKPPHPLCLFLLSQRLHPHPGVHQQPPPKPPAPLTWLGGTPRAADGGDAAEGRAALLHPWQGGGLRAHQRSAPGCHERSSIHPFLPSSPLPHLTASSRCLPVLLPISGGRTLAPAPARGRFARGGGDTHAGIAPTQPPPQCPAGCAASTSPRP